VQVLFVPLAILASIENYLKEQDECNKHSFQLERNVTENFNRFKEAFGQETWEQHTFSLWVS
jgi:hypothetical protein